MKLFKCSLCKLKENAFTRAGIRKHLREEHFVKEDISKSDIIVSEELK